MRTEIAQTFVVKIYLSGPIEVAKQVIRQECLRAGLCVTIEPTLFIYTGGEEAGYVVGLLQYPRFPVPESALLDRARVLMEALLRATSQHSALLVGPQATEWVTLRNPEGGV